jgi:hypothetical protein
MVFRDLGAALTFKKIHAKHILIASIETSESEADLLWNSPEVRSVLDSDIDLVRLLQAHNPTDIQKFASLFQIPEVPSVIVIGPDGNAVIRTWRGRLPGKAKLTAYLSSLKADGGGPDTIKVAVETSLRCSLTYFPRNATIRELKAWIRTEFGGDLDLVVSDTRQPLPTSETLTLVQAGFTSSVVLREPPVGGRRPSLATLRHEVLPDIDGNLLRSAWLNLKLLFSLLNPWAFEDPPDPRWEFQREDDLGRTYQVRSRFDGAENNF